MNFIDDLYGLHLKNKDRHISLSTQLCQVAQEHANWMFKNGMSHRGRSNSTPWSRVESAGYNATAVAENIAKGYTNPNSVMLAWLASSGHRRNILGSYDHIGIGECNYLWCVVFANPESKDLVRMF